MTNGLLVRDGTGYVGYVPPGYRYNAALGLYEPLDARPRSEESTPSSGTGLLPRITDENALAPTVGPDGGAGDPDETVGGTNTGWSPGRSDLVSVASMAVPGPVGFAVGAGNAALGAAAEDQKMDMVESITGNKPSWADRALGLLAGATGLGIGSYSGGIGGYSTPGKGGIEGAIDFADPGVAGSARGIGRSNVGSTPDSGGAPGGFGPGTGDQAESQTDADEASSGGAESGAGGDSGGCVVATEMLRQGIFTAADRTRTVRWCVRSLHKTRRGNAARRGYRWYGRKFVKLMRRSPLATTVFARMFKAFSDHVTGERRNVAGAVIYGLFFWPSALIGLFARKS